MRSHMTGCQVSNTDGATLLNSFAKIDIKLMRNLNWNGMKIEQNLNYPNADIFYLFLIKLDMNLSCYRYKYYVANWELIQGK